MDFPNIWDTMIGKDMSQGRYMKRMNRLVWKMISIAVPLIISAVLVACGGGSGSKAPAVEPNGNNVDLVIEASNWEFNEKEYRVKAGDTVKLTFKNVQGMHGIDIRGMNISLRGDEQTIFVAQPGTYDIICNIPCGQGHSTMKSKLIVE